MTTNNDGDDELLPGHLLEMGEERADGSPVSMGALSDIFMNICTLNQGFTNAFGFPATMNIMIRWYSDPRVSMQNGKLRVRHIIVPIASRSRCGSMTDTVRRKLC